MRRTSAVFRHGLGRCLCACFGSLLLDEFHQGLLYRLVAIDGGDRLWRHVQYIPDRVGGHAGDARLYGDGLFFEHHFPSRDGRVGRWRTGRGGHSCLYAKEPNGRFGDR